MREIKFRAVIKTPDGKIEIYPCGVFEGEVIISTSIPYVGQVFVKLTKEYGELVGFRQYTGLKDKQGREVYEGDIIKCSRGCPHIVEWVQEHGGQFLGGMPTFYLSGLNPGYAWTGSEEVLGNIYENPELLEVSHEQRDK